MIWIAEWEDLKDVTKLIQKASRGNILRSCITIHSGMCYVSSSAAGTADVDLLAHVFTATHATFWAYIYLFPIFLPVYLCKGRIYCFCNCSSLAAASATYSVSFSSLSQCGFFQRSRYEHSVPRYHAVRIRREERQIKDGECKDLETKQWFTKWNENESYS